MADPAPASYDKRAVFSWALYDFANSSFTTLVVTFIYGAFFTKLMAETEILGTALWSRGVTITAITVALLSPIMGALADRGGYRKLFLFISTVVCVVGTVMLYFPEPFEGLSAAGLPSQAAQALIWFVVANIAFEMGGVFYNAFLPDLAPGDKIGRISGYGWALGYVGGLLCMMVAFAALVFPDIPWFGITKEASQNIRATNLLVAGWFALFSIPMFLFVKEDRSRVEANKGNLLKETFGQLAQTFKEIRPYRQVVRLLVARLFYNDGLVTIFAFGGIYAGITFGFDFDEIILFGIVLNITAGLGAFLLGFLDDKIGGKRTIQITIVGLSVATLLGVVAPTKLWFWIAGILIGIFSGPNQSASRSLLGRFVPPDKENEFYGFFAFSGKATAFMGPFLFGILTTAFGTQRAGVAAVLVFFLIGGILLQSVNEKEGIDLAGRPN